MLSLKILAKNNSENFGQRNFKNFRPKYFWKIFGKKNFQKFWVRKVGLFWAKKNFENFKLRKFFLGPIF